MTPPTTPTLPEKPQYWRMETPSPPQKNNSHVDESPQRSSRRTCLISGPSLFGLILGSVLFGAFLCSTLNRAETNANIGFETTVKSLHVQNNNDQEQLISGVKHPLPANDNDGDWPKLAWLMTFPNSGTSYTTRLIRHLTGMSTATTYGHEWRDKQGLSVPLFTNSTVGPFLIEPTKYTHPKGHMYIATKTHCGGRCGTCGPPDYIESPSSFLFKCLTGTALVPDKHGGTPVRMEGTYSLDLVKRIIHLFRNPFDNVVSRFHLSLKRNSTGQFTKTREGFRDFCALYDEKWTKVEHKSIWWDEALHDIIKDVPCHADFYRYANWHNLAFAVTSGLGLPLYLLHYENFESRYEETENELMEFLHLKSNGNSFPFIAGKSYIDYFTKKERRAVKKAMEVMAYKTTWEAIKRYFDDA